MPESRKIIPGSALSIPEDAHVIGTSRIGNDDRDRTVNHIKTMTEKGYLTVEEANLRIDHAMNTYKQADLRVLTSDLPAPVDTRTWVQSYNWDNKRHWIPTLVAGVAVSAATATVPASVLAADHLFPHNPIGLAVGLTAIIAGIVGFVACIVGMIIKD
jgi:Domain of unknown function (DUF1707)